MHKWPNLFSVAAAGALTVVLAGCGGPNLFDRFNNFWSYGLCSTIVVVLDIIALVQVVGSDRSTGDKLLWGFIIIVFPVLGCILYYMFGKK